MSSSLFASTSKVCLRPSDCVRGPHPTSHVERLDSDNVRARVCVTLARGNTSEISAIHAYTRLERARRACRVTSSVLTFKLRACVNKPLFRTIVHSRLYYSDDLIFVKGEDESEYRTKVPRLRENTTSESCQNY